MPSRSGKSRVERVETHGDRAGEGSPERALDGGAAEGENKGDDACDVREGALYLPDGNGFGSPCGRDELERPERDEAGDEREVETGRHRCSPGHDGDEREAGEEQSRPGPGRWEVASVRGREDDDAAASEEWRDRQPRQHVEGQRPAERETR